jgi:phenylalanyl-tRNA synthetase alpha chain
MARLQPYHFRYSIYNLSLRAKRGICSSCKAGSSPLKRFGTTSLCIETIIVAYTVPKLTDYSEGALDIVFTTLLAACREEAQAVAELSGFKLFRDRWLSRKNGLLTQVREQWLKGAPSEAKGGVGQRFNRAKGDIEFKIQILEQELQARKIESATGQRIATVDQWKTAEQGPPVDITLPGIRRPIGAEHPVIKTWHEIVSVFQRLGYSVAEGPVVETDYYNFEALNFPPNHPARDTQDTLFIAGQQSKPQRERLLLRTHTSPVQIRTMEKMRPPIRIVIPGTVHRNDPPDASHSPMFHQIEGLAVDTNITFGDLKGTLDHAMKALFGSSVKTHFRPSFFPFTEPSAELYVTCFICGGSGRRGDAPCRPCKQTGWIEVLGCGMVDPNVFEFVKDNGYDPKKVSGFAFGAGIDRLALLKYGVDDIQLFFQGDVRFLQQFG